MNRLLLLLLGLLLLLPSQAGSQSQPLQLSNTPSGASAPLSVSGLSGNGSDVTGNYFSTKIVPLTFGPPSYFKSSDYGATGTLVYTSQSPTGLILVKLWGAPGYYNNDGNSYGGGAGAYVSDVIQATSGTRFLVVPGKSHGPAASAWPNGGAGGEALKPNGDPYTQGGSSGGGSSQLLTYAADYAHASLIMAAGGGGSAAAPPIGGPGAGQLLSLLGAPGNCGDNGSAPGTKGANYIPDGCDGTHTICAPGGGGGGGFGGGKDGCRGPPEWAVKANSIGAGGGGSLINRSSTNAVCLGGEPTKLSPGVTPPCIISYPGNASDPDRIAGAGQNLADNGIGGCQTPGFGAGDANGLVVIYSVLTFLTTPAAVFPTAIADANTASALGTAVSVQARLDHVHSSITSGLPLQTWMSYVPTTTDVGMSKLVIVNSSNGKPCQYTFSAGFLVNTNCQ